MTSSNSPLINQFVVSNDFIKMHTMPDHRVYAVQQNETIVDGSVSCYTRHKGFFRDVISSVAIRHIVLTKTGYILIWMKYTQGFTLRLSRVCDVSTETSALKYRTGVQKRCVVKMHFPFGTLNVILTNGQIDKWRNALISGCDKRAPTPVPTPRNTLVETATSLALVPPLPKRNVITSSVILHPPTIQTKISIDEWTKDWVDADTITPPSTNEYSPFRYDAVKITIPRSKTFHVTKSTVLPSSLLCSNNDRVTVSPSHSVVSSDTVVLRENTMETSGQKSVVVKRSHTINGEMEVPREEKKETERYSAVDRWLRSQIEKRVKRLDGVAMSPEPETLYPRASRPRSHSADANMVSLRSNRRYSLV